MGKTLERTSDHRHAVNRGVDPWCSLRCFSSSRPLSESSSSADLCQTCINIVSWSYIDHVSHIMFYHFQVIVIILCWCIRSTGQPYYTCIMTYQCFIRPDTSTTYYIPYGDSVLWCFLRFARLELLVKSATQIQTVWRRRVAMGKYKAPRHFHRSRVPSNVSLFLVPNVKSWGHHTYQINIQNYQQHHLSTH